MKLFARREGRCPRMRGRTTQRAGREDSAPTDTYCDLPFTLADGPGGAALTPFGGHEVLDRAHRVHRAHVLWHVLNDASETLYDVDPVKSSNQRHRLIGSTPSVRPRGAAMDFAIQARDAPTHPPIELP